MKYEILYDESEKSFIRYVSYAGANERYDFGLVYTKYFIGKTIVFSLQSLKVVIMSYDDLLHDELWMEKLDIHPQDVEEVKEFLQSVLPLIDNLMPQY